MLNTIYRIFNSIVSLNDFFIGKYYRKKDRTVTTGVLAIIEFLGMNVVTSDIVFFFARFNSTGDDELDDKNKEGIYVEKMLLIMDHYLCLLNFGCRLHIFVCK